MDIHPTPDPATDPISEGDLEEAEPATGEGEAERRVLEEEGDLDEEG